MNLKNIRSILSQKEYIVVNSVTTNCEIIIKRNNKTKINEDDELLPQFSFQEVRMLSALPEKKKVAETLLIVKEVFPLAHMVDGY